MRRLKQVTYLHKKRFFSPRVANPSVFTDVNRLSHVLHCHRHPDITHVSTCSHDCHDGNTQQYSQQLLQSVRGLTATQQYSIKAASERTRSEGNTTVFHDPCYSEGEVGGQRDSISQPLLQRGRGLRATQQYSTTPATTRPRSEGNTTVFHGRCYSDEEV